MAAERALSGPEEVNVPNFPDITTPSTSQPPSSDIERTAGTQLTATSPSTEALGQRGCQTTLTDQTNYVPRFQIITIFLACASVDFVAVVDQTTLAAALSILSTSLQAGSQVAWFSGAYFLTTTVFSLLYGRLSDIWSRKYVLYSGLAIFFLGSLASSLAQTAIQLIVFRAMTGIGGGGLANIAQAIVSDVVPLRERGKYQGILGAWVAIANGIGPVIGGALAQQDPANDSWRWIFRLNMFLSLVTALCVFFLMPLKPVQGSWKNKLLSIDFTGCFLALAFSTLLVLSLTWAGTVYPWSSPQVLVTLILGLSLVVFFTLWQSPHKPRSLSRYLATPSAASLPLIPLHVFRSRIVIGATTTMFINGYLYLVQVFFIPTFYQLTFNYSAVRSGALLLPLTLIQTLSSTLSGLIIHATGRYRENILAGWAVWSVGLGLFSTIGEGTGVGKQIGYALLTGFGVGQTLQPSLIAIQAGVDRRDMAVVTSTRNFIRNLGGILGLAISGTVLNNYLRSSLAPLNLDERTMQDIINSPASSSSTSQNPRIRELVLEGYKRGFRTIFISTAALAAAAAVLAFWLMPQVELDRADDERLKREGKQFVEEGRKGRMKTKGEKENVGEDRQRTKEEG